MKVSVSTRPVVRRYSEYLLSQYPSLREIKDLELRIDPLISDHKIELPENILKTAQDCIKNIFTFAHSPGFQAGLEPGLNSAQLRILKNAPTEQKSVLMAYDFHWSEGQLSLIEINTNASSFLFVESIYRSLGLDDFSEARADLKASFLEEKRLFDGSVPRNIAILDESPEEQKQYLEFLMYRDIFTSWEWNARIEDVRDFRDSGFDFIYNRHTDFYLEHSDFLRQLYLEKLACVSPSPREYLLLADKERMGDFAAKNIHPAVLKITKVTPDIADDLWTIRKEVFFKPKRSFGSKGVYKGSSISRTAFDRIVKDGGYIAQEYSPPGSYGEFKCDLRFFVYQDEIQLACARLYKGQVTGFDTVGGGLAPVTFVRD